VFFYYLKDTPRKYEKLGPFWKNVGFSNWGAE
jgi:hypothetical protein